MINAIRLIIAELKAPTGQSGPLAGAYLRAVGAGSHALLGASFCAWFGWYGLALGLPLGAAYWVVKERGDLRRGGGLLDGIEDAIMVSLGAWYGTVWWPSMVIGCMGYIMVSASVRVKK